MTELSKKLSDASQLISDVHSHHINYQSREIYVHGAYGGADEESVEPGVDYRMATTFLKNLHVLEHQGRSNILVHMHTIGGEWADGLGMFDAIMAATSSVTILAHAHARSMSGILMQAADKRIMMPNAYFLIHHGWISVEDRCEGFEEAAKQNKKDMKKMLSIFADRAINGEFFREKKYKKKSQIMSYIDKRIRQHDDWYMTAEEAVYYGFVDAVLGDRGYENVAKTRRGKKWKKS